MLLNCLSYSIIHTPIRLDYVFIYEILFINFLVSFQAKLFLCEIFLDNGGAIFFRSKLKKELDG